MTKTWEQLSDQEQIYLYWEYCCGPCYNPEKQDVEPIPFEQFDETMKGFVFYENHT